MNLETEHEQYVDLKTGKRVDHEDNNKELHGIDQI